MNERKNQDTEDSFSQNREDEEIVMSMSFCDGKLGAAFYDKAKGSMNIMGDVVEDYEFSCVYSMLCEVQPTTLIVSKTQDMNFLTFIEKKFVGKQTKDTTAKTQEASFSTFDQESTEVPKFSSANLTSFQEQQESEEDDDEFLLNFLQLDSRVFRLEEAKKRVARMFSVRDDTSSEQRRIIMNFRIDFREENMIRASGALLKYMDSVRLGVEYKPLSETTPIRSVQRFVIEERLSMDWNTLVALDVFPPDSKSPKSCGRQKRQSPSSLFEVLNMCRSIPGKSLLRRWMRNPLKNIEQIAERQKGVSFFAQDYNMETTNKLLRCLGRLKNTNHVFKAFHAGTSTANHWDRLIQALSSLVMIGEVIEKGRVSLAILSKSPFHLSALSTLRATLLSIIDLDKTFAENRFVVQKGRDPGLDQEKEQYESLGNTLAQVAIEEAIRLGIDPVNVSCVYIPIVGFLLVLPTDFVLDQSADIRLIYEAETQKNVKTNAMDILDSEIGDIKMRIIDRENVIMMKMKNFVLQHQRTVSHAIVTAATIDVLIAFSQNAAKYGWTCPQMINDEVIEANCVVHPLYAESVTQFVPNNVRLGKVDGKVKILSGPNACGKSVYMKMVGLLVYMTCIGSFVAAKESRIGPVDLIITRMYTIDAVLSGMSTFAVDVSQVALALKRSTKNSLVILDEFGKGTLTEVGLSLLASCLCYWINRGEEGCPHLLISSHFHSLYEHIPINNTLISFHTFEVKRHSGKIHWLYKMISGVADCSFAINAAKEEGIPTDILLRAVHVYSKFKSEKRVTDSSFTETDDQKEIIEFMNSLLKRYDKFDRSITQKIVDKMEQLEQDEDVENKSKSVEPIEIQSSPTESNNNYDCTPMRSKSSRSATSFVISRADSDIFDQLF